MAVNAHSDLVNKLLIALSLTGVRVWKNHTGVSFLEDGGAIKYGLVGSADITGIVRLKNGMGIRLEIECKTGTGKLRESQMAFRDMIVRHGGVYIEARDVPTTVDKVLKIFS